MAVMFSKVKLTADNGAAASFLCSGCPTERSDLQDWTAYQDFISDNAESGTITVDVDTYLYGDGEIIDADEYEVAYFVLRGEDFLNRSTVRHLSSSAFRFDPPERNLFENTDLSMIDFTI